MSRVAKFCKQGRYADRIGSGAPVYLASVLEYMTSEIIELAGSKAQDNKKQRINPRHVMLAIKSDEELNKLFENADFAQTGVPPNIHEEIIHRGGKKGKMKGKVIEEEEEMKEEEEDEEEEA